MNIEQLRRFCLSLPHVTEDVKWDNDLTFLVGGKMFAVSALEPPGMAVSFKCTPANYSRLTEMDGIVPAPYLARYDWVSLETFDALGEEELKQLISDSYRLILEKLPASKRKEMQ